MYSKMIRHSHLAVIQKHAIHLLNGAISCVLGLEMDKSVALGAIFITHHLAHGKTYGYVLKCIMHQLKCRQLLNFKKRTV